jgi:hypothetical protein
MVEVEERNENISREEREVLEKMENLPPRRREGKHARKEKLYE